MEQTLTPPPSFRVLRVRTRAHTRTISNENKCGHITPARSNESFVVPSLSRKDASPARGRTRSRIVRNDLSLNTNCARPHLPIGLPPCCSPPRSRSQVGSAVGDDDLIFQMSPIQTQSPTLVCFDGAREVPADASRVKQSTMQTLSALWEKHKTSLSATASQPHSPQKSNTCLRADTLTQHQRGFSDTHANAFPRRGLRNEHRPQQSAKALFDFSSMVDAPPGPPSPPAEEPFMYSFPSFNSGSLVKARQARARRQASQALAQGEYLTGSPDSVQIGSRADNSLVDSGNTSLQRFGPIRARKLRIQSGESLSDDMGDTNFISHAFKSASLDPEKDIELDDGEFFDNGYFSSQRSSSISSSSTDAANLDASNAFSSSLLASFPVQPSSRSRTQSSSKSRPQSHRSSPSKVSPEAHAKAMMTRGRATRRASEEKRQSTVEYVGGDRRGRGRTPVRDLPVGNDERIAR